MDTLHTSLPDLRLTAPDVERDAPIAVQWLEGEVGRNTLQLMGNPVETIVEPSLEAEKERIQSFLSLEGQKKQLTWMIQFREKTVGAVWVELEPTEHLPAPAIHIMIGDPSVRGQGVGESTVNTVFGFLADTLKFDKVYSRHLTGNQPAHLLLERAGFEDYEEQYRDTDGLEWQNVQLKLGKSK